MFIIYHHVPWPKDVEPKIGVLAQGLEARLADVRGEAILSLADAVPATVSVFVVMPGEADWRLEVPVKAEAPLPDVDTLARAMRAAATLAAAWLVDRSESAIASVMELEPSVSCARLAHDVWQVDDAVIGDVAHIWGEYDTDDRLPPPAAAFKKHFADPLYDSQTSEFAPFGSDEGNDLVREWGERSDRLELDHNASVADLLEGIDPNRIADDDIDTATIVVAAGFTLLRLTGRIDRAGRRQTLKALRILAKFYDSPPEIVTMTRDLESWFM